MLTVLPLPVTLSPETEALRVIRTFREQMDFVI